MKKLILIAALIAVSFGSFSYIADTKFPEGISAEKVAVYNTEYLKTIDNDLLNEQLSKNFAPLFDQVSFVDAQYSETIGYYYIVFGTTNESDTMQLLKVEKEDIDNETYSYIDFSNIKVSETTIYCFRGYTPGATCPQFGCNPMGPSECEAPICGVYANNECHDR